MKLRLIKLCSLFLFGCSNPSSWIIDSISTGDLAFDSSRFCFLSTETHSPLHIELLQFTDQIETYLYLSRFRFTVNPVLVRLNINGEFVNDLVPVYEGGMRLRLSEKSTKKIIHALQDGLEVGILVDGFEEKLRPAPFNMWAGRRALPNSF